jgi:hypothetical protein
VEISRDGRGAAYRIEVASGESSVDVIGLEPGVYVASVSALSYGSESARSAPVLFTVPTP